MENMLLRSSTELDKIFEALSAAQAEMTDPGKTKTAAVGKYSYRYADLVEILKIIRPAFAKHGLLLLQVPLSSKPGMVTVVTRIGHKSGQWIEFDLPVAVADDRPQTLGSAITYGRRYSASGVANIAPDDDEDGTVAQHAGKKEDEEGFDPKNRQHQDWFIKQMRGRKIPDDRWDDIGKALKGRPSSDLSKVLETRDLQ